MKYLLIKLALNMMYYYLNKVVLKVVQNSLTYAFYITRHDYVRLAVAILEDWQNNTCEGKYLKSLWENRNRKNKLLK